MTGANGKIGNKLVLKLLNNGFYVMALVRNKSKLPFEDHHLKIIEADILESKKYSREIRTCDYVYHLAAYQNILDQKVDEFIRVNVDGTKVLLDQIVGSKVKRFIYISTVMVFKADEKKLVNEKSLKKDLGGGNYYVATKLTALDMVRQYTKRVPTIVLYPAVVIDPEEIVGVVKNKMFGWQKLVWNILGGGVPGGLMSMIGKKNRVMNYVFIDSLLETMVNAMKKGKNGDDFILGGENITVENYLREIARIKRRVYLPLRIPVGFLKLISLLKIPQLGIIDFIANNPPEDMGLSSQKAIKDLGLKVGSLKDYS